MTKTVRHSDTDYLAASAYVRALENSLLTREQLGHLIAAPSHEDARKLLQAFGYGELDPARPEALDAALFRARAQTWEELAPFLPDAGMTDLFRVAYDYHNVKAMLKAEAMGVSPDALLTDLGRVRVAVLRAAQRDNSALPAALAAAIEIGREALSRTRDPQLLDVAVDKCCFHDLLETAERTGSAFLVGYVRLRIDAANLRTLVRTLRMRKREDFLRGVLFERGEVPTETLLSVCAQNGAGLADCFASTALVEAAAAGARLLRGDSLTEFERLCDDAQTAYLSRARLLPFGEEAVFAYLAARETEYMNLRVVLMGRMAGVSAEVIRSRLRA